MEPYTSFPFDTKSHKLEREPKKEIPQHVHLSSLMFRNKNKFEQMNLTLRVHGVYNLPDQWKSKIVIQIFVTIIV